MPEPAARALSHVVRYAAWKRQPVESPVELADVRREEAALLLAEALGSGGGWLTTDDVRQTLDAVRRAHRRAAYGRDASGGRRGSERTAAARWS